MERNCETLPTKGADKIRGRQMRRCWGGETKRTKEAGYTHSAVGEGGGGRWERRRAAVGREPYR